MNDPYKLLGLEPGAASEEIRRAYRTLVRRYPPELNPERFARIHDAYERLSSFAHAMSEAQKHPEEALAALFPPPAVVLRPPGEEPAPLEPHDLEPLLRPLSRLVLERLLRQAFGG